MIVITKKDPLALSPSVDSAAALIWSKWTWRERMRHLGGKHVLHPTAEKPRSPLKSPVVQKAFPVAVLAMRGLSQRGIARKLVVSRVAVSQRIIRIERLCDASIAELAAMALRDGLESDIALSDMFRARAVAVLGGAT